MYKISNADTETVTTTFLKNHQISLPQGCFDYLDEKFDFSNNKSITVDLIIDNNNTKGDATLSRYTRNNKPYHLLRFKNDVFTEEFNKIYSYSLEQYKKGNELNFETYELYFSEEDNTFHMKCIPTERHEDTIDKPATEHGNDTATEQGTNLDYTDEKEFSYEMAAEKYFDNNITPAENRIYYGTPGCGKSHTLNENLHKEGFIDASIFRTVFHVDYANSDFVGQVLPQVEGEKVTYKFVPGIFTRALEYAIANQGIKVALVIEEINRGNAPAIFGELFQLLDRDERGISKYKVNHLGIVGYLNRDEGEKKYDFTYGSELDYIKLPANLFLYATMNTSDQNVFTLDTAFKRRWKMEKVPNTFTSKDTIGGMLIPGFTVTDKEGKNKNNVTWQQFVETINDHIVNNPSMINAEDKQLGKYFVTAADLISKEDLKEIDSSVEPNEKEREKKEAQRKKMIEEKAKDFANKVLEYIWSDVAKFNRKDWFKDDIKSFDKVLEKSDFKEIFIDSLATDLWNRNEETKDNPTE